MAWSWLPSLFARLLFAGPSTPSPASAPRKREAKSYEPRRVLIRRSADDGEAPPLHWSPCHPSTISRFKAELTCSYGHGLVLRSHRIDASGDVFPSVVCPSKGCAFHEYVKLDEWSFGSLPQ